RPSVSTTTRLRWNRPSPSANVRPSAGRTPSTSKNGTDTAATDTFSGSPSLVRSAVTSVKAAIAVKDLDIRAQSTKSAPDTELSITPSASRFFHTIPSDSGCGYGSGLIKTVCTAENTAVLAPIARASVTMMMSDVIG